LSESVRLAAAKTLIVAAFRSAAEKAVNAMPSAKLQMNRRRDREVEPIFTCVIFIEIYPQRN